MQKEKNPVGRPKGKKLNFDYKRKRAVSLTDSEFSTVRKIFGSATECIFWALKQKEKLQ